MEPAKPAADGRGLRRRIERGPTGSRVAANVRRLRDNRGLTVKQLAERLSAVGRPILPSGVTKLENGDRSVDVDDLMALAYALECTPNALLLTVSAGNTEVGVTEGRELPERHAWGWARAADYQSYQLATRSNPWAAGNFDVGDWARSNLAKYQKWSAENRPDAPVADPETFIRALTDHRDLLNAHANSEETLLNAGVSLAVIDEWMDRQRGSRAATPNKKRRG